MTTHDLKHFVLDASGLLGVLDPHFGDSKRILPGRKLTQMAKLGMITVAEPAMHEATHKSKKAGDWISRNVDLIRVSDGLDVDTQRLRVEMQVATLPGFLASPADVEGASVALAMKTNQTDAQNHMPNYVVVHDVAYEAACILLGVATVRPEAFVEAFGALPLHD